MTDEKPAKPAPRRDRFNLVFYPLLLIAGIATFLAWRRARNPLRMWAKRAEIAHAEEIDVPLQRCFGTTRADGIRRLAAAVQRGPVPAPFRACDRMVIAEVMVAPNAFLSRIAEAPVDILRLRERTRVASQRLSVSLRQLERAVTVAGTSPTDAQRQEIARKLEDLVPDVDQERKAFEDMITIARDQAGWF